MIRSKATTFKGHALQNVNHHRTEVEITLVPSPQMRNDANLTGGKTFLLIKGYVSCEVITKG